MSENHEEREKLLRARVEIEELLNRHGLIGFCVLAGQDGLSESIAHLEASWSALHLIRLSNDVPVLRLRSVAADYVGKPDAQKRDLESSLGALASMAEILGSQALSLLHASAEFDAATGTTHTGLERLHKQ